MNQIRAFFYVDSGTMLAHCVAAAELVRKGLDAHIIMMVVDRDKHFVEPMKNYELYDYTHLFDGPISHLRILKRNSSQRFVNFPFSRKLRLIAQKVRAAQKSKQFAPKRGGVSSRRLFRSKLFRGLLLLPVLGLIEAARAVGIANKMLQSLVSGSRVLSGLYAILVRQVSLARELSQFLACAYSANRFLARVAPDIIFLPEDNIQTMSRVFVAKGRKLKIPTIVVPFTIPNPAEPARYYFDDPLYQMRGFWAWVLTSLSPKWRFTYEGKELIRQPAIKAICQECLGVSSPAPWVLNRGDAAYIALDSEVQHDLYVRLGFPPGQLRVIGDLNGESFNRRLSQKSDLVQKLCFEHSWDANRPLILCGFPPDQYEGTTTANFEFESYGHLIKAWMESFEILGEKANVLIRPHPRVPLDRFAGFDSPNIKITSQATAELVPLCDLYVASISATIRWAIACGVPVVNYDTYRYRYDDYKSAAGVLKVEDLAEFRNLLSKFVNDSVFATSILEQQRNVMASWGILDDAVGQRLSKLVTTAMAESGQRTAKL